MITNDSAKEMTTDSLTYTRLDLLEVIAIQERTVREFGDTACPKLGQYWDELCAVSEEVRRREGR
jgi:hypothetical protein